MNNLCPAGLYYISGLLFIHINFLLLIPSEEEMVHLMFLLTFKHALHLCDVIKYLSE